MAKTLIEMRYIKDDEEGRKKRGQIVSVPRGAVAILEARKVAIRVRPPHSRQKPITSDHAVTKGA
jgi:hypothetical protein